MVASWSQSDELSGTDPGSPTVAEVNASPLGDAAGEWIAFADQPVPGDGRRTASTHLGGLLDGRHLVRVRSRDRAGNAGAVVIGSVVSDRTPPRVADVSLARPVTSPTALAELLFRGDDSAGVGLSGARAKVGPAGGGDEVDWAVPGESGAGRVLVRLPGPGVFVVTVRLVDRVGNRGESAPVTIRVPTPAEAADAAVGPPLGVDTRRGAAPSRRVAWVVGQLRGFHRERGVRLTARVRVARDSAAWRRVLGTTAAARYTGYSTLRGDILLGPAATRGLEVVGALGLGAGRVGATSRADLDGAVLGPGGVAARVDPRVGPPGARGRAGNPLGAHLRGGVRRGRHGAVAARLRRGSRPSPRRPRPPAGGRRALQAGVRRRGLLGATGLDAGDPIRSGLAPGARMEGAGGRQLGRGSLGAARRRHATRCGLAARAGGGDRAARPAAVRCLRGGAVAHPAPTTSPARRGRLRTHTEHHASTARRDRAGRWRRRGGPSGGMAVAGAQDLPIARAEHTASVGAP